MHIGAWFISKKARYTFDIHPVPELTNPDVVVPGDIGSNKFKTLALEFVVLSIDKPLHASPRALTQLLL